MKTHLVLLFLTAGATALAAQPNDRERGPRSNPGAMFDRVDTNGDEVIDLKELTDFHATLQRGPKGNRGGSNAEADTPPPPREEGRRGPGGRGGRPMPTTEEMFAMMDINEDGTIARDEFSMGNRRGRGGPERGNPGRANKPE